MLVDPDSALQKMSHDGMRKEAAVILSRGESVWVPFGWVPILLGLPSHIVETRKASNARQKSGQTRSVEYCSVLCSLALDRKDAVKPGNVRMAVAGELTKGFSSIPESLKASTGFQEWKAALEKPEK